MRLDLDKMLEAIDTNYADASSTGYYYKKKLMKQRFLAVKITANLPKLVKMASDLGAVFTEIRLDAEGNHDLVFLFYPDWVNSSEILYGISDYDAPNQYEIDDYVVLEPEVEYLYYNIINFLLTDLNLNPDQIDFEPAEGWLALVIHAT